MWHENCTAKSEGLLAMLDMVIEYIPEELLMPTIVHRRLAAFS